MTRTLSSKHSLQYSYSYSYSVGKVVKENRLYPTEPCSGSGRRRQVVSRAVVWFGSLCCARVRHGTRSTLLLP